MLSKKIFWTLLITGMIAVSTTTTQAQSTSKRSWLRGGSINNPAPDQAAERAPVTEMETATQEAQGAQGGGLLGIIEQQKNAIVGTWLFGNSFLVTNTSDGVVLGSGRGDISLAPDLPAVTPQHGAWTYLGGRQFAAILLAIQYDVPTGEFQGLIKIHSLLTVNEAGDQVNAMTKVEIFDAQDNLVDTISLTGVGKRVKVEPFH